MEITNTHYGSAFAIIEGEYLWEPTEEEVIEFVTEHASLNQIIQVEIWRERTDDYGDDIWGFEVATTI